MKTEYKTPFVVTFLYGLACLMLAIALGFMMRPGNGFLLLGPAFGLFLLAYLFDLLSHILYELQIIRAQGMSDFEYFLLDSGKSTGPFPLSELLTRLRAGTLHGNAQVQRLGSQAWITLDTLTLGS